MRARSPIAAAAVAVAVALGGCGGTSRVLIRSSPPPTTTTTIAGETTTTVTTTTTPAGPSPSKYVRELRSEEQTLAAAERSIPTRARTPQQLAHSATLLAVAVSRLAQGLATVRPPAKVAADHAHLVAVARSYASQLRIAASMATRRGKQASAGALLISATNTASTQFGTTLTKIYSTLGVARP